ncbi:MAG TPA: phosphotransferase, partial [Mycobacteriales bacterium]|nr:phosphotransferase [Mycobacteriales bacterium]
MERPGPDRVPSPRRARIDALAAGGAVEPDLDAWAAGRGLAVGGWRRVFGRLQPPGSPWAVLAYEAVPGPTVRVLLHEPGAGPERAVPAGPLGLIEISTCESDPALPGLPAVLAGLRDPAVVRYRPGNRCTVRGTAGGARFVKVMSGTDDQVDARELWAAARSGALSFAPPQPHGWDEPTRSSWYGVVPGGPIAAGLLGPDGASVARRIGAALGELAVAPLHPVSTCGPADQLARTGRALARAAAAAPALAERLEAAGAVLDRVHARLPERPLVPVHGAPHMHQWLVDGDGRLGLVDFDRYARGEPELDIATFLVELETESPRAVPMPELTAAVVAGFAATGGELDPAR